MADSLLDEVDADVRAERLHQLWLQYRYKLLFVVIAIIFATAATTVWENYREKRGGELLQQLSAAQSLYSQGKMTEAADGFAAVAKDTHGDVQVLAQLWQARALTGADKKDDAVGVLKDASERNAGIWSDLACLRLAALDTDAATNCLADKKDSPLITQRQEWYAAELWSAGKKDEATALLESLQTSPDTSDATRATTGAWLATMRAEETSK